jgi:hypothetical protein
VRTDPTDNGGLFVGRRPGTAPVRYRELPDEGSGARRRADRALAAVVLGIMVLGTLLFWGPIPVASLWIASQVQYRSGSIFLGLVCGFAALLAALLGGLVVLKRLDEAWVLIRRAGGADQRQGVLPTVFWVTSAIGASAFTFWLLVINGPGSTAMPG